MSSDPPGDLTPMHAVVLPGMAEPPEPVPPPATGADVADGAVAVAEVRPAGRSRRGVRTAVVAAAAGLLVGPLIYSFATGPGGGQSPRTALPPLGLEQPLHSGTPSPPDLAATPAAGSSSGPAPRSSGAGAPPAASNGAAAGVVTQTSTAAPAGTTVVKTSGVGCANDNSQNWYTNGMDGTWSEKAGGAGGCGRFVSMPMSGEPSVDGTPYVVWWFETSPVVTGACAVTVYIPSSGVPGDVAGHPAFYKILGGRTSSTVRASFTIDQTVNRGRWVSAGTFPLSGGAISIHLGNRGAAPAGERLGAAQVRVSCTPS
ncbi:hypothetical protein OHA72_37005 [Dactylosporangium sp. NBC_01737]|uniref:hypothetical protein n=1 Tax=Dactylosporangium sp. NBC_01737 TaxID=2975959 RepID=UPI002E0E05BC|nr:hypothetical protein OHA72_37005 [Dactylosporangium sp. NBC_01737]